MKHDKKKRKLASIPLLATADEECVHAIDHDNELQNYLCSMNSGKLEPMGVKEPGVRTLQPPTLVYLAG